MMMVGMNYSYSQKVANPIDTINNTLKKMFSKTTQPRPNTNYLYELSSHTVDTLFYEPIVNINSNTENWFMIFEEMNNMMYSKTNFIDTDSLYKKSQIKYRRDTIPIGILHKNYYTLTSDALSTGKYFDFDTVNNILYDKVNRPLGPCGYGPYCQKTIFSISTLNDQSEYSSVEFAIDPSFIFIDKFNSNPDYIYKINLDDGNGFKTIAVDKINFISANYSSVGDKNICIEVYSGNKLIARSISTITILNIAALVTPDFNIDYEGLYVSVFGSCYENETQRKIAIVLEGIDPFDVLGKNAGRSACEVYDNLIRTPRIEELRNYGYEFWVVNWKNSMRDMKENADYVIKMIRDINTNVNTNNQYVVIGESMGGVIARYALTKMEHDNENHETRELITIDSPHGGANIPISMQLFYRDIVYLLTPKIFGFKFRFISNYCKIGLDSKAAKQLLLYHVNTAKRFSNTLIYKQYSETKDRTEFVSDLKNIGNYPKYCKLVAVTDGSISGKMQNRAYSPDFRKPGDKLFDFNGEIFVKILKLITIKVWGVNLQMNTNPNGNGKLYNFNAGFWLPKIKLYMFGVRLNKASYSSICDFDEYGYGLKPYCVNAGGIYSADFLQPGHQSHTYNTNSNWAFLFSVKKSNNGIGLYDFQSSIGNPYLASVNANFSIYSDGFHFGFIPVQSSIDYDGFPNNPLDQNLIGSVTNPSIMKHTPFDVVIGPSRGYNDKINDVYDYTRANNLYHVQVLYINQNEYSYCLNDNRNLCDKIIRVLNTEIGEDRIWLDNTTFNQSKDISLSASTSINVNTFNNPFYTYLGEPFILCNEYLAAGFSKKNDVVNISNNKIVFKTNKLDAINLSFTYVHTHDADVTCCELVSRALNLNNTSTEEIKLYPNPFNNIITLKLANNSKDNVSKIELINLLGEVFPIQHFNNTSNVINLDLSELNIKSGIYFLKMYSDKRTNIFKIIKND